MEPAGLDFRDLADLRLFLQELLERQVESLAVYYDPKSGGFYHRHDKPTPGRFSKSSTATCVSSLIATGHWHDGAWHERTERLTKGLLNEKWESAGLDEDNVFTVAFALEAVGELMIAEPTISLDRRSRARLEEAEQILRREAKAGALRVQGYPPSAYVTQLVVRVLKKQKALHKSTALRIALWAEHEINKQLALLAGNDKTADVFQLAYAAILLSNLVEPDRITPDQDFIIDASLRELFRRQRDDGTWPLSRPLFHYPHVGSAHCYDYEMLVQLLSEPRLTEKLLRYLPELRKSAVALNSLFPLGAGGAGWSSGHHPQFKGPESWSTASVYHFAHALERLLPEQIRRETFAYLGSRYLGPRRPRDYAGTLPASFLDCQVGIDNRPRSLKRIVSEKILKPLISDEKSRRIELGRKLSRNTPVSIILFGPPGTSKSRIAKTLAEQLGWPFLAIDPSQFLKNGMDGVYLEADRIFARLAVAERIVVLLDEFDEMVKERGRAPDVLSRFLTTAMLPMLIKINENRRIVVIVATNHIEEFDVAIRRPGRFDVILQVMPPTAPEKLRKWKSDLSKLGKRAAVSTLIQPLTFTEMEILVRKLKGISEPPQRRKLLKSANTSCTLQSRSNPDAGELETWKMRCDNQRQNNRVP